MRLVCPDCSATYRIAADRWPQHPGRIGDGFPAARKARCRMCGAVWLAQPLPDRDDAPDAEGVAAVPPPQFVARRRRMWPVAGIAAVAAAGAGAGLWLLALAGQWQPEAIGLPPAVMPSADATRAAVDGLGLPIPDIALPEFALPWPDVSIAAVRVPEAPLPMLALRAGAVARPMPDGGLVWEVRGEIRNPGPKPETVPPLEVTLTDADGSAVARWTMRADAGQLPPGGTATFQTSAVNPPATARGVTVRLHPGSVARR